MVEDLEHALKRLHERMHVAFGEYATSVELRDESHLELDAALRSLVGE